MKKSTKAALFSALIIPGAGHVLLKRMFSGIALILTYSIALCVLIVHAVDRAQKITDKILSGDMSADVAVIADLVSQQPIGSEGQQIELATTVLIAAWIIGVLDSYRIGRRLDAQSGNIRVE